MKFFRHFSTHRREHIDFHTLCLPNIYSLYSQKLNTHDHLTSPGSINHMSKKKKGVLTSWIRALANRGLEEVRRLGLEATPHKGHDA